MEKHLFLGDEAVAQAAIDAGLSGVYAYPGTPSTEITEFIQGSAVAKERGIHCRWSTNEKTAMEAALGMSYAGKRALCCMKHVGLNVAADCFMNAAMSGVNGGMIIITADDPSMHSSQNEQDNRMYGNFAMIPMLEPASQQEAYDMVYDGFELSENWAIPFWCVSLPVWPTPVQVWSDVNKGGKQNAYARRWTSAFHPSSCTSS